MWNPPPAASPQILPGLGPPPFSISEDLLFPYQLYPPPLIPYPLPSPPSPYLSPFLAQPPLSISPVVFISASTSASAFRDSSNHSCRCSALILEGPPDWLLLDLRTAHSISSYVGNESSTGKGSTDMEIFSSRGCTWQYITTRSAVILSRVT